VVFIHNEILFSHKKNEILSFAEKWMELENIIVSEVRHRRPKISCSSLYADCKTKTNAVILLNMGHMKRRTCTGGIGKG
jgi:hypothetical protein